MTDSSFSGAYGFRLQPLDDATVLPNLLTVGADAPAVSISWVHQIATENALQVDRSRVLMGRAGAATLEVLRVERVVRLQLPEPATVEAIVHPLMTAPLAILARWRGNATLHAGGVLVDGAAYAVCGGQTAGKSTMLACLARRGFPIAADDLLVVDGDHVLAGPNCIDLRPDAARRFPAAKYLGVIGARPRHRLTTVPAPARVPLRGVFLLAWSDGPGPEVASLTPEERVRLLHGQDYAGIVGPPPPAQTFALLGLPMWRLSRPRSWGGAGDAVEALLRTARGARPASDH